MQVDVVLSEILSCQALQAAQDSMDEECLGAVYLVRQLPYGNNRSSSSNLELRDAAGLKSSSLRFAESMDSSSIQLISSFLPSG